MITTSENKLTFKLEQHPKKKGTCPNCNQTNCFRYYEGLPKEYGICDHKNKCGYHANPYNLNKFTLDSLVTNSKNSQVNKSSIEPQIIYPDEVYLSNIMTNQSTYFHKSISEKLNIPKEHLIKWAVGGENGFTCFIYQNENKPVNVKKISYNDKCKRNKDKPPFYLSAGSGKKYGVCLYGEHLLSKDKVICLVESEKTAVIASFKYPEFDWLATGGSNGLTVNKVQALIKRKVYYIGDSDIAGKVNSTLRKLKEYGIDFTIIELFPGRTDGYDLADAIFDGQHPEIKPLPSDMTEKTKNISEFEKVENFISARYDIRKNTVSNEVEYKIKDTDDKFAPLNLNNLYRELQRNFINFSINKLTSLLDSDFVKEYDPFIQYFEGLPKWENNKDQDYISILCGYIPTKDKSRFLIQFKKMLVRSIACSITNVFNKQAFVLVHDMQNSGKSTFCRWLCPPQLGEYIAENINMDKDSLISLTENFIINMDELATMNRAEINQLKAFMSKDVVKVRPPYGRKAILMKRRANFVGSTNKNEFLNDETGSVRWLCFELTDQINFKYKQEIDINLVWSQAYSLFKEGFKYELTPQEIKENEEANKQYRITTTEQELLQDKYMPGDKSDPFYTATRLKLILENDNPGTKLAPEKIGKALKILGFKQEQSFNGNYMIKGYYIRNK